MLSSHEVSVRSPNQSVKPPASCGKGFRKSRQDFVGSVRARFPCALVATVALFVASLSFAQAEPEHPWIGREAAFEKILRVGEILEKEQIGHGVTRPVRLNLAFEGVRVRAVWKPLHPLRHGEMESYQAEIAAYRLSRALGLDMVPPTVERRIGRNFGSVQLWIEDVVPYTQLRNDESAEARWPLQFARMQFFDHLIDNPDRNSGNFLIDPKTERLYLIDHSRALNFAGRGRNREKQAPRYLDRYLADRLQDLTQVELEAILGDVLKRRQVRGVERLRDQMLEHVEGLADRFGQTAFFVAEGNPPKIRP